jgi:hypothetical protein
MVDRLCEALGHRLVSVVLYGPEAHGDHYRVADLHLLVVTEDLEPETLALLADPVRWWLRRDQAWPRLFTPELLRDAADVYPVELLDLGRHRRVLIGEDPLAGIEVDPGLLRLQCERELREKLMRLREGFVDSRGRRRPLTRLLAASFASLAPVWRACLHLLGIDAPDHDRDAAALLCRRLDLDATPFDQVARVAAGHRDADPDLFARYTGGLAAAVARIDRLLPQPLPVKGRMS